MSNIAPFDRLSVVEMANARFSVEDDQMVVFVEFRYEHSSAKAGSLLNLFI